jgi:hypothetical protein
MQYLDLYLQYPNETFTTIRMCRCFVDRLVNLYDRRAASVRRR